MHRDIFGHLKFHKARKLLLHACKLPRLASSEFHRKFGVGENIVALNVFENPLVNKSSRTHLLLKQTRFIGTEKLSGRWLGFPSHFFSHLGKLLWGCQLLPTVMF